MCACVTTDVFLTSVQQMLCISGRNSEGLSQPSKKRLGGGNLVLNFQIHWSRVVTKSPTASNHLLLLHSVFARQICKQVREEWLYVNRQESHLRQKIKRDPSNFHLLKCIKSWPELKLPGAQVKQVSYMLPCDNMGLHHCGNHQALRKSVSLHR